jgi:mono/diheme cytochrome c family protein
MRFLRSRFTQAILILVVSFVFFRYGIQLLTWLLVGIPAPTPWSVVTLFMAIVLFSVLVFVSADSDSWRSFVAPIRATLVDADKRWLRGGFVVVIPLVVGFYAYSQAAAPPRPPAALRSVHPAPPTSIQFQGQAFRVVGVDNPLRQDPGRYDAHVARGGEIYIRNCMVCHGDYLDGRGPFAAGFNPPPANFQDPGTIAMLEESYVFWRIAKGGPGLPREGTPWDSAMPAWEGRLTEEEHWQVTMYLFHATGYQPRRWEGSH